MRFVNGQPQRIRALRHRLPDRRRRDPHARPVGLAVAKDGALLMADDANGVVYRVAYDGASRARNPEPTQPPAQPMLEQAANGVGVPLALDREEATRARQDRRDLSRRSWRAPRSRQSTASTSTASRPRSRGRAVTGAKSYVIIMEDPDAKPITPFVHWVAWNIPASDEPARRLAGAGAPDRAGGCLQGRDQPTIRIGYFGPAAAGRRPVASLHFQVLALDTQAGAAAGRGSRQGPGGGARDTSIAKGELSGLYQQRVKPPKSGVPPGEPVRP